MNLFKFLGEFSSLTSQESASTSSESIEEILVPQISWADVFDKVYHWLMTTGLKLLIAIIALIISFGLINFVTKKVFKRLQKKHVDETINRVIFGASKIGLKLLVLTILIAYVGINGEWVKVVDNNLILYDNGQYPSYETKGEKLEKALMGSKFNFTERI